MWKALIKGDPTSLETLEKNFSSYIQKDNNEYYINCPQFQNFSEQYQLYSFAKEKLQKMVTILEINFDFPIKAKVTNLVNEEGDKKNILNALSIKSRVYVLPPEVTTFDENGKASKNDPLMLSDKMEDSLECISNNLNIRLAFDYFHRINDDNLAFNLYTILEIIGEDLGGSKENIYNELTISRNKFRMLKRTLNHGLGNKSRHYNAKHPPADFYSEEEVKNLVKSILKEWFENKCLELN